MVYIHKEQEKNLLIRSAKNICTIDGRYSSTSNDFRGLFSEFALFDLRLQVELRWLRIIIFDVLKDRTDHKAYKALNDFLTNSFKKYSDADFIQIKKIERTTNHDIKALEYFIKEKISLNSVAKKYIEFVHFGCTSDDITNVAYAIAVKKARDDVLMPTLRDIINKLIKLAFTYASTPMLSHTHGVPASPTTVGKEFANFVERLREKKMELENIKIKAKFNGSSGNFSALNFAFPEINWLNICEKFVKSFGLSFNEYTTQIEPHDWIANFCDNIAHINNISINLCRDLWMYNSLEYLSIIPNSCETGSSVMPHKVNPVDFENAEGNFGMSNALALHFSSKLTISRMQRDLTDSTVMRNLGLVFSYHLVACKSLLKGLSKIKINEQKLKDDLDLHWEVTAEAIQTVMRKNMIDAPYEKLKSLTRGKKISQKDVLNFISNLKMDAKDKYRLTNISPCLYTGIASDLAKKIKKTKIKK